MRLPYECQTIALPAQAHITQFLLFLGASDVQFSSDALQACIVQWCLHGEQDSLTLSAQGYISQWMRSRVWERRQPAAGPMAGELEHALAVVNFWYFVRDQVLSHAPVQLFELDKRFQAAAPPTLALLHKLRLGHAS